MPIYEYLCQDCQQVSSFLIMNIHLPFNPICQKCQSKKMTRLISRIARVRSEESRLESLADPSKFSDLDERDPASMARWMKKMGKELGEDLGDDFEAMVDEAVGEEAKSKESSAESQEDDF